MRHIKFSKHSLEKISILRKHGVMISKKMVKDIILNPQKVEKGYKERLMAQGSFDETHVLRVVYEEPNKNEIIVITMYPGRKKRYEEN